MITNRTTVDVKDAIILRKRGAPFSSAEQNTLERGMVTINTLNRVERKQTDVRLRLAGMGYYSQALTNKTWRLGEYFKESDLSRLIDNDKRLKDAFYIKAGTQQSMRPEYSIATFNALEKWLADMEDIANYIDDNCMECDTFWCGEY